ncbi:hypothetical protein BHM03_00032652, partial [Ensete ventricosum]
DAKAVGSCRCYLEVLEQDARAGDGGCCYLRAWEQDAKMVGTSGGYRRWTSVRDRSVKEQQIWFGIARLDAQATVKEGLSWPRLPPGRIRHCGCLRGE